MKSVIIAYPNKNTAMQIKNILEDDGLYVSHICATAASVLNIAEDMHSGVVVCASILRDMPANALAERLSGEFDIVAISKSGRENYMGNLISLPIPLDREEFVKIIEVLISSKSSFTKREKEESDYISDAKTILMSANDMSEMQAHKYLQKLSMSSGKKMADAARDIIKDFS